jgi:hypothetical protein
VYFFALLIPKAYVTVHKLPRYLNYLKHYQHGHN